RPPTVQVVVNAMNANTATIVQGYMEGVIQSYNQTLRRSGVSGARMTAPAMAFGDAEPDGGIGTRRPGQVQLVPTYLYNPGLVDSWFIATGVFGLLIILNSSLIASGAMVKEREAGTVEQLLMSPASTTEIIVAKLTPLFVLLCMMMLLAITVL